MKHSSKISNTIQSVSIILLLLILFVAEKILAQQVDYSGTSVANFLKIGVSARPMAMGDAAIATVNSADAMYWNVAALSRISDQLAFTVSTMDWLVGSRNSYIAAAYNMGDIGTFGFDLQYLDYGKVEETTVYAQTGTGKFVSANDMEIGLGYAKSLTDRFSFGIKVKHINETLAAVSGSAFAVDLGVVFLTSFLNNNLRFAATLSNFGTKLKFTGRDLSIIYTIPNNPSNKQIPAELSTIEWDIPLLLRLGISSYFVDNDNLSVLLAYDILDSRDYEVRHNLGAEIGLYKTFYLRGGYKFNYDEIKYTMGFGLDFQNFLEYKLKFDYVYLNFGVFGSLNQFTLSINL
ncbi:MAG: PorV/PorQ family protein [Ignavibacterium sp.]|uniref:PorV/PorQ family protein n=1 Tax=Ignavibacterium sp. TaxID=2651167 RepID=UPI00404A814F